MTPHHATLDIPAPCARVFPRLLRSEAVALLFDAAEAQETTHASDDTPTGRAWTLRFQDREERVKVTHAIPPDSLVVGGDAVHFLVLTLDAAPRGHTRLTVTRVDREGRAAGGPLRMAQPSLCSLLASPTAPFFERLRRLLKPAPP